MNKIIIPLLMIITLSLSGCIFDPFYHDRGYGGGYHHGGGWGYRDGGGYRN
jgi:hypothetical protein